MTSAATGTDEPFEIDANATETFSGAAVSSLIPNQSLDSIDPENPGANGIPTAAVANLEIGSATATFETPQSLLIIYYFFTNTICGKLTAI